MMTQAQTTSRSKPGDTRKSRTGASSPKTADSRDGRKDRGGKGGRKSDRQEAPREFEQKILDLARVTRVTAGGKRMSFRCALIIGDKKGRVGLGVAKGADVQIAVDKAYRQAKKNLVTVPIVNESIPHAITYKFGSATILLKPAPKGSGLKAGGAVRVVLEYAGVPNAVSKILNSSNKLNIAQAVMCAIAKLNETKLRIAPKVVVSE